MKSHNYFLSDSERLNIEKLVKNFEQAHHVDLLITVAKTSDEYPAAKYRFALTCAFLLSIIILLNVETSHNLIPIIIFTGIFFFSFLFSEISYLKRLFLNTEEIEREVREKASELFHIFLKDQNDRGIFLYLSLQEHRFEIRFSKSIHDELSKSDIDALSSSLSGQLHEGSNYKALENLVVNLSKHLKNVDGQFEDTYDNSIRFI